MTKNSRYRMLSVLLISVFGQFSGNGLGYCKHRSSDSVHVAIQRLSNLKLYILPQSVQNVIYENLGYTDVKTQLALNLGGSFLGAVCGVTGALFADKMVRSIPGLIPFRVRAALTFIVSGIPLYSTASSQGLDDRYLLPLGLPGHQRRTVRINRSTAQGCEW